MAQADLVEQFTARIMLPPGLPVGNPSQSAWQEPPHATVSSVQSPTLPEMVDIAVIGSGITGSSVAYALLHDSSTANLAPRIAILEARNAVSGATGRNGGHLVSDAQSLFPVLVENLGKDEAVKILRFSEDNIARLKSVVAQLDASDREIIQLRDVISTVGFRDEDLVEYERRSIALLDELIPMRQHKSKILSKEEAESKYCYRDIVGALEQHGSAALSPYRLVTALLSSLIAQFGDRFSLETNTPVATIVHDATHSHPYALQTPRGALRAKKVIHCTNGHSGHLVPGMAGKLWPFRGTMSVQAPGPAFPQLGSQISWNTYQKGEYDPESKIITAGLYYAQQNPVTGDIWVGGEVQKLDELLSGDDSTIGQTAKANILSQLGKIWRSTETGDSSQVWSGVMGFTSDNMPIVGKLTMAMTGREGDGEWIAAGFNGHGMDKCWLTGEAIAQLAVHGTVPQGFPESYLLTTERSERLTPQAAVDNFLSRF